MPEETKGEKLKELPASDDKWWGPADKYSIELEKPKPCKHHFVRISGREVECKQCNAGFFLGPDTELKDGHLYHQGQFMI